MPNCTSGYIGKIWGALFKVIWGYGRFEEETSKEKWFPGKMEA